MAFIVYSIGVLAGWLAHRAWIEADPATKEQRPALNQQAAAVDPIRANERNQQNGTTSR